MPAVISKEAKKVLFVNSEIFPYLPESDIATVGRFLPQGIQEKGYEIRSFMPRYGCVNERRNQLHEVIRLSGMNIVVGGVDRQLVIKVASISSARMQVYFIDNEDFFHRKAVDRDADGKFFADNDERAVFFARGVLETVKKLRWNPDIIHCHGWLSALIPLYVKTAYREEPAFRESKVVYSLYDQAFKQNFHDNYPDIIPTKDMTPSDIGTFQTPLDYNAVMKKAIDFSDGVICNSPSVDASLPAYAKQKGIPVLEGDASTMEANIINDFYDTI